MGHEAGKIEGKLRNQPGGRDRDSTEQASKMRRQNGLIKGLWAAPGDCNRRGKIIIKKESDHEGPAHPRLNGQITQGPAASVRPEFWSKVARWESLGNGKRHWEPVSRGWLGSRFADGWQPVVAET